MINATRLFPYKCFDELAVRPEDVTLTLGTGKTISVKARPAIACQPNQFHLFADEELGSWTGLQLKLRILAQPTVLEGLLPAGATLEASAEMIAAVSCAATKLRRRVFLTPDTDHPGEWYGSLDICYEDIADVLEVTPLLTRKTLLPEPTSDPEGTPLASHQGAVLAYGEPIQVLVDEPKNDQSGSFKITWEDFSQSTNEWRRSHDKEMFYVETGEDPQVFLNSRHDLLKQTLMKKRPSGSEATIRNSLMTYIAHTTWSTLFLASIADCRHEENQDVTWPQDPIKVKVLKRLLPLLVPERTDDDARLDYAVDLYGLVSGDTSKFGTLLTKLHSGIQNLIKVDDFVIKTLEATAEPETR